MTKQTKDAWMRMRTAWMKRGDTDLVQAVDCMLYADEPTPLDRPTQPPRYIPKGVPCVVWDDSKPNNKWLTWSCGDGTFVGSKSNIDDGYLAGKWPHARPVCFPEWTDVVDHKANYLAMFQRTDMTWGCVVLHGDETLDRYDYYETRPEVTK